jgi:purine nucleosidase/pyrimidine-specific ribonucleoside hydrolase
MRKKVIIDCDPGMDDSMAIIMAIKSKELAIEAITTVNGNYPVEITSKNARKVLEMLERTDIPVAQGMSAPMIRKSPADPFSHGKDGQAENNLPEPRTPLSPLHAIDMIIEKVNQYPGEITLVCCGPLSNVAMAIVKEPGIKNKVKEIVAISGAFGITKYAFLNATGDTPQSEWNVFVDPEAASIVYNSGILFTAIGLDIATHFQVDFSEEQLNHLKKSKRKEAAFLSQAIDFVTKRGYGAYCAVIDCLAVAFVVDPSLVETFLGKVAIELEGRFTLGNTVLEQRQHHGWENLPEIVIGKNVNYAKFLSMIIETVIL